MSVRTWLEDGFLLALAAIFLLQVAVVASSAISTRFRRRRPRVASNQTSWPSIAMSNSQVRVFTYGVHLYEMMLADIKAAKHTIFIESFIWKGDQTGTAIKEAVISRANDGLDVYVIFDAFANLVVRREFKRFPQNVRVFRYRAWRRLWDVIDPRSWARDHRKLLVIDHNISYIGGYNIGDLYGEKWRDTHVRIKGESARNLSASFIDFWNEHNHINRAIAKATASLQPYIRLYVNNPTRIMFPIRSMYIEAIDLAKKSIYLTTPYFIPDRHVLASLVRAAHRGVDVQLVIPEQSNHLLADWLARTYFTDCLKQGIHIYLYQGSMIHAKTATIDGTWTTVGTANLDRLSLMGNHELNVEFFDSHLARQMEEIFRADRRNCRQLQLQEWTNRPMLQKLGELVLSPLWPFL